jgi:predicted nucleic acid-binding Zn ribbon protein
VSRDWRPPDPVVGRGDGPHRHDVTPVGRAIDRLLDRFGAPPADALAAVFERWPELAGSPLGDHGRPLSIEDGTLVVAVDDGTWATEWRYRQGDVLRRCDDAFGPGVVARIEARVRPRG